MEIQKRLTEIADNDGLPGDHPLRGVIQELNAALSQSKKEKNFAETLLNAQSRAFAAYASYTGKIFEADDESPDE